MKLNYINPKLKRVYARYKTLQTLKQTGKITADQQEELIRLCKVLIDNLIQDNAKMKKQNLMDTANLSRSNE
jgi:rRNA pseudouridine-1189 N-methylase Emg1 (Nep1/Mra1 family)